MIYIGTVTFNGSPAQKIRGLTAALRPALEAAVRFWHRTILPKHFLPLAMTRYGYQLRKKGYMIRKARKKGHQNPIMWTGDTKRRMQAITVTSTGRSNRAARAKGSMPVPWYITVRSKKGKRPDYKAELTATTPDEIELLKNIIRKEFLGNLALTRHVEHLRMAQ